MELLRKVARITGLVKVGLHEEVTFEQRLQEGGEVRHVAT